MTYLSRIFNKATEPPKRSPVGSYSVRVVSVSEELEWKEYLPLELRYLMARDPRIRERLRQLLDAGKAIGVRTVEITPENVLLAVKNISFYSQLIMLKLFTITIVTGALIFVGTGCVKSTAPSNTSDDVTAPLQFKSPATMTKPIETMPAARKQAGQNSWAFPGLLPADKISDKQARIKTNRGDIVLALYDQDAPKTVSNFVYLAEAGFYDNLTFHRREEGFVIQGGDPNGNGTGGPGYKFEDEPVKRPYDRGIVAMANSGPNTNGSQFFIMLTDNPLPPNYTIFGMVTSGMDVVDKIMVGDAMTSVAIE